MTVFLSFEFESRNAWIRELVVPLISSFGMKPVIGEVRNGNINDEIKRFIEASNGLIAFYTAGGKPNPKWIIKELAIAESIGIPTKLCVDKRLDPDDIVTNRGEIFRLYNEANKAELLVKLACDLSDWKIKFTKQLVLIPKEIRDEVSKDLINQVLRCSYQYKNKNNGKNLEIQETNLIMEGQGLVMYIDNMPNEDALVEIVIQGPGYKWVSGFVSLKSPFINLQRYERNPTQ